MRKRVRGPEEKAKLEEIERLYNESRYELAEIRIKELEEMLERERGEEKSLLPQLILLLIAIAGVAISMKMFS